MKRKKSGQDKEALGRRLTGLKLSLKKMSSHSAFEDSKSLWMVVGKLQIFGG